MQNSNHSGYTNFDGSPDLAPDAEPNSAHLHDRISMGEIEPERWMYLASGLLLAMSGLMRRGPLGLIMSVLGGSLLYQGITSVNPLKHLLNFNDPADPSQFRSTQTNSKSELHQEKLGI